MPFGMEIRKQIRERSGFRCQICGEWHPPRKERETELDAHSLDLSHQDTGLAVCRARVAGNCHNKIHLVTDNPIELKKISREAANLNAWAVAMKLEKKGIDVKKIRRILERINNF